PGLERVRDEVEEAGEPDEERIRMRERPAGVHEVACAEEGHREQADAEPAVEQNLRLSIGNEPPHPQADVGIGGNPPEEAPHSGRPPAAAPGYHPPPPPAAAPSAPAAASARSSPSQRAQASASCTSSRSSASTAAAPAPSRSSASMRAR